jgi:hypothetical protein
MWSARHNIPTGVVLVWCRMCESPKNLEMEQAIQVR